MPATATGSPSATSRSRSLIIVLATLGQFLVVLDVSIVNVALPAIRDGLGFSPANLAWVVNGYALTFAGFLLVGGRAADLYGRKRIFIAGLVLFAGASLIGGLAGSPAVLIGARVAQGVGAAVLSPATLTILSTSVTEPHARARAIGTWGAVGALGGAVGSLIGGVLTSLFSWRAILLLNVPLGILLLIAAAAVLQESQPVRGRGLDLPGALSITLGLSSLSYAMGNAAEAGWRQTATLLPLLIGLGLVALFLLIQARLAPAPLMPLSIFRLPGVAAANLVTLVFGFTGFSFWFFMSLGMQNVLHYGPLITGLAFLPQSLTLIVAARLSGKLLPQHGARRIVTAGLVVGAAGFAWSAGLEPGSGLLLHAVLPGMVVTAGMGLVMPAATVAATAGVTEASAGLVSGVVSTARQVGGSLGLAALSAVAAGVTTGVLGSGAVRELALARGYSWAFLAAAAVLLLGLVVVPWLPSGTRAVAERDRATQNAA